MKNKILKVEIWFSESTKKSWFLAPHLLHRENDQPAVIWPKGDKYWYKNGIRHRDNDLPAQICRDGYMVWYQDGKVIKDSFSEIEDRYDN